MQYLADRIIPLALLALACGQVACSPLRSSTRDVPATAAIAANCSSPYDVQAALNRAASLEAEGDESCVDAYFQVCRHAWSSRCAETLESALPETPSPLNASLARLLEAACRFGRLDFSRGLAIRCGHEFSIVPVVHHGFSWNTAGFQRLHFPRAGDEPLLSRWYACEGFGVPVVLERRQNNGDPIERRFYPAKSFFAATAMLRFGPMESTIESQAVASAAVLEFHNPLHSRSVCLAKTIIPLAADFSAPLALSLEEAPRSYFAGFIEPGGSATSARLSFLEPYQPGKVPVVLVHGLFSDPLSWGDLVNDLRATPGFSERFQLWVFRYPTGQGFLRSAAALRGELQAAVAELDPLEKDVALRRMVVVGHSMGGLIAKLQVTYSGEVIWSRLAKRPLEEIAATAAARRLLTESCFFDPSPHVSRVIFIATPHAGSLYSSALIGRGAALLVEPSPEQAALHEQLVRDNPNTFYPEFERRLPTSIDMLVPSSPLLDVMQQMRFKPEIALHSIIGVSNPISVDGPSDGVVSARSASHPGCESVLAINARHSKVHRALETSTEVLRILDCHWKKHCFLRTDRQLGAARMVH